MGVVRIKIASIYLNIVLLIPSKYLDDFKWTTDAKAKNQIFFENIIQNHSKNPGIYYK